MRRRSAAARGRTKLMQHAISRTLALAALLAPLAACGGSDDPVDLGHDDPRSLGSALSDYAGAWEGRAEAYEFDDGSDRLQLEIRSDGTGDLLLGDSRLPAPDPNHGFPPSLPSTTPL